LPFWYGPKIPSRVNFRMFASFMHASLH